MFPRSFRARLTWFFAVIVVLPLVAVSVVLFDLVADAERGKADAGLSFAETAAQGLFGTAEQRAAGVARRLARSRELAAALASREDRRIDAALRRLARRYRASRVEVTLPDGRRRTFRGADVPVAPATIALERPDDRPAGTLRVAVQTVEGLADTLQGVTGLQALVVGPGGRALASTLPGLDPQRVPARGEFEVGGIPYRVTRRLTTPTWDGRGQLTVRLLADQRETQTELRQNQFAVAGILLAFLVLAGSFALTLSRSLQQQLHGLLRAARRLGRGELDAEAPTEGNDEFAALGAELNLMARQLESRLQELECERERLAHAFRRVGESFAKSLDRDALLDLAVQTAVEGVAASVGRAKIRDAPGLPLAERASAGQQDGYAAVLDAVEAVALERRAAAEVSGDDLYALSHPLRASDRPSGVVGLITVARRARAFSGAEQELFHYLASQASVSIENVGLHESVQRQAITDGLTGLFNHRRFQEVMAIEVERARRYGQPLALVMLDLDDFKTVNDRYGHLQGDLVLREVARVLMDSSREIDEPARYGGEEMAVALPQTDLEGAHRFAERVRQRIETLEVPMGDGDGAVRVTASFGVAALPVPAAADKDALVAAADGALYEAKRLGRNRVVTAR